MKIRGNTVGTTMPRPDWNQTNPRRADYILNKPRIDNIICSAEGDVIAVADASDHPLKNLILYGKSVQNGTPTPDAPVPIVSAGESGEINIYALDGIANAMPVITEISYPVTMVYNEFVYYSVIAIGNNLSYQWQYKRAVSPYDWVNFTATTTGYNEATLTVKGAETRVNRPTRCLITDASGHAVITEEMTAPLGEEVVHTKKVYFENQQTISIPTPHGLPGLPVSSGGNYTDENGQMWLCDTIENDKYMKRLAYHPYYVPNPKQDEDILSMSAYMSSTGALTEGAQVIHPLPRTYELDLDAEAETVAAIAALHTYKPNTTIVNDAGAGMAVEYVADTKAYIDNKFTELAAAIVSNV